MVVHCSLMRVYGPKYGVPQEPGHQPDGSYVPNEYYMQLAIAYAEECIDRGQHPVGAVVTRTMGIFSLDEGYEVTKEFVGGVGVNEVENDSSLHAEMVALRKAEMYNGRRRLGELKSVLYTTHEPCPMCAGAIANSKLHGVVYGTSAIDARELVESKGIRWRSNRVSGIDIIRGREENGTPEQFVIGGFLKERCLELLGKTSLLGA
jgi:tRNA(adenine34) deaminase